MTQDSTAERRRARMAFMDDKKGTQAMATSIIYVRQEPDTAHAGTWCDVPDGGTPYVPQAAIAAAMMGAVNPLEWFNIGSLGDLRAQSIVGRYEIIAQPNGSYSLIIGARSFWNETLSAAKAVAQSDYQARILPALSIPADAMAALDAAKAQVRLELIKEVLTAIYEGKRRQGLVDVRFDFASDTPSDAYFEEAFKMEMAVLAGNTSPLDFGDLTLTDDQIRAMEGCE